MILAIALGALIWLASPMMTGRREPWDAHGPYYILSLFIAGAIAGWIQPQKVWRHAVGIMVGQLGVMLWLTVAQPPVGANLLPLGVIVLAGFALVSLIGAGLAAGVRRRQR